MTPVTSFAGKRVALFGLGGSGLATALALKAGGAEVVAFDDSEQSREKARKQGIAVADLRGEEWSRFDALVLAPGVPLTHPAPHWTVELAKAAGVEIIGDIELFCRERAAVAPGSPFVAITGTNGKSTTTALVAHILREAGRDVQMGGNIGTAILSLEPPSPDRIHVVEMSSFQIDLTPSLAPTIGVLMNITPDHLDRHGTMENYARIKSRILPRDGLSVLGVDDQQSLDLLDVLEHTDLHPPIKISGKRRLTEREVTAPTQTFNEGVFVENGIVTTVSIRHEYLPVASSRQYVRVIGEPGYASPTTSEPAVVDPVLSKQSEISGRAISSRFSPERRVTEEVLIADLAEASALRGLHNAQNAAAATAVVLRLGCSHEQVSVGLRTFPGLAHRMEQVGRRGQTIFVNDSKATNADSTEKALTSFERIYWILGGMPKEGGITTLRPYFPRVAKAYLIGEAAEDFAATLGEVPHVMSGTLDKAVEAAAADAAQDKGGEHVVLLSPACASYDQYRNFEIRGDHFRDLVRALPGIEAGA